MIKKYWIGLYMLVILAAGFFFITPGNPYHVVQFFLFMQVLFYIPGYLISSLCNIHKEEFWDRFILNVAISISYVYAVGLIINWLLPLAGITNPLSSTPAGIAILSPLVILTLLFLVFKKGKDIPRPQATTLETIIIYIGIALPIMTYFGTNVLNNDGPNTIIYFMLVIATLYLFLVIIKYYHLRSFFSFFALLSVSASVLLMLSMRSYFIAGFDISNEYQVFQITKGFAHWSMSNFPGSAYNACLSITLLPTVFSSLIQFPDQYIFKLLYPLMFSLIPLSIVILTRKLAPKIPYLYSFLAAVFFVSQPWFVDPMVTIARQEIAFFFFIHILLMLFDNELTYNQRKILLITFSAALVISHYSTSYITAILLTMTYVFTKLYTLLAGSRTVWLKPVRKIVLHGRVDVSRSLITFIYILIFTSFTFLWYSQITRTSNNLGDVSRGAFTNIGKLFSDEMKSGIVNQVLTGNNKISAKVYSNYYKKSSTEYANRGDLATYTAEEYNPYAIMPMATESLPITDNNLYTAVSTYYKIILILIEICLLIGVITLFFNLFQLYDGVTAEYISMCLACTLLLAAIVILPFVSQAYNFDRMYLQSMMIMSSLIIIGSYVLFRKLFRVPDIPVVIMQGLFIVSIFAFTFGLIWQLTGGKTVLWLNNFGLYYDLTYTHKEEAASAKWLADRYDYKLVYTFATGRNILWAYAKINNTVPDVLPSTLDRNSWIYLTYANTVKGINYFYYNGTHLGYVYPKAFIDSKKNKVYSNGGSEIYQ